MIGSEGHIIHIDYGFILGGNSLVASNVLANTQSSNLLGHVFTSYRFSHNSYRYFVDSPGFNINFESAPFKFTREYAEIMGGFDSTAFAAFEELFTKGFLALQKHIDGLTAIIQVTVLPTFYIV